MMMMLDGSRGAKHASDGPLRAIDVLTLIYLMAGLVFCCQINGPLLKFRVNLVLEE